MAVAKNIGSHHETLDMDGVRGTWDHVTGLLLHAGQPFADTSLFAVNAVCKLMRRHVTVALSGDGGDEAFGGYDLYWQIARIARMQRLPEPIWRTAPIALLPLARFGLLRDSLPQTIATLNGADDTAIVERPFRWVQEDEHRRLCQIADVLPVRRLLERQWEHHLPPRASRIEKLSAHATEVNTRLLLANDFLFKVDTASMRESLEVRVPMLDEDLFSFALSLPHSLKVDGRNCKRVLRAVAERRLPPKVAKKPKMGFGIPVDTWVNADFKARVRDALFSPSSRLPDFFRPEAYRPIVEAFCDGGSYAGTSREGLYQRAIMLLSIHLVFCDGEVIAR